MSPKKKRGGKPPTHPSSATFDVCSAGSMQAQASLATASSSSSNGTLVQIIWHCLPISLKPHHNFIHCETWTLHTPNGKPAGLFLNDLEMTKRKKKKKGEKTPTFIVWVSLPLSQSTLQCVSTKAFALRGEMKGGHLPSLRRAATRTRHYCEIQPRSYPAAGFAPAMVHFRDQFV